MVRQSVFVRPSGLSLNSKELPGDLSCVEVQEFGVLALLFIPSSRNLAGNLEVFESYPLLPKPSKVSKITAQHP